MAQKKRKKKSQNGWQPQADDAIKLAAIRWFACTIEAEAIQIYATNSAKYQAIESAMRACVAQVRGLSKNSLVAEDDCPPGYVLCGRDCAPMCENEN